MNLKKILSLGVILAAIPMLFGCWMAAGAGAYGGYKMKEKGYTVQNPITKEKVTTRPIFHEPHLPKQFVWRQEGYIPCWPWIANSLKCDNRLVHIHLT